MNKKVETITHIGDLHCRNYIRKEEYYEQFNKFLSKQRNLKPDRIFIGGDILHNKGVGMSPELFQMVSWFLMECSKICDAVILICGNHDTLINNKDRLDGITPIIESLNLKNIWYFKDSGCYIDNYDKNIVYVVYSCLEDQKDPQLDKFKEKYDPRNEKTYITFYHGMVKGSSNSIGYVFSDGIDIQEFKNSNIVMLNDIHEYQTFEITNDDGSISPAAYSSSLIMQNHGESVDNHGFILWDIKKGTHSFHNIDSNYGFYTIELDGFDNLGNEKIEISKKPNLRVQWKGKSSEYSSVRQKEVKDFYIKKYNPNTIIVNFESSDKNDLMSIDKNRSENISDPETQRELIISFLTESGQLDDEELEIEINENSVQKEPKKIIDFDSL